MFIVNFHNDVDFPHDRLWKLEKRHTTRKKNYKHKHRMKIYVKKNIYSLSYRVTP